MEFTLIIIGMLSVLNPIGAIPVLLNSTTHNTPEEMKQMIRRTAISVAVILLVSAWFGEAVLGFFSISIDAFRTAGGLLIILMGISMLHGKQSSVQFTANENAPAQHKEDISVVPLAMPLLAGPGAISLLILDAHKINGWFGNIKLVLAILIVASIAWLVLTIAEKMQDKIGTIGLNVMSRIMGLILTSIGVQFITTGISHLLPGLT